MKKLYQLLCYWYFLKCCQRLIKVKHPISEHTHKHTNIMANIRFSPLLSLWLAALTFGLVVQLSVAVIEITVCYHSVSMGQKNISLLPKQAHTRWCSLSVDKQLAFWGPKLQFVPHRKQATPVCAAEWSQDSAPHNRKQEHPTGDCQVALFRMRFQRKLTGKLTEWVISMGEAIK